MMNGEEKTGRMRTRVRRRKRKRASFFLFSRELGRLVPQFRSIGDRPAGLDIDVERHRFKAVGPDFDAVRTGL
jgi:hypothetical protein